jgi:alpha-1,6-mannosyltransferase
VVPVGPARRSGPGGTEAGAPADPGAARPALLRAGGLLGAVLMAAGAFAAGALPGGDPGVTASSTWWLGLAGWLAGLLILSAAWWRLGTALRHPDRPRHPGPPGSRSPGAARPAGSPNRPGAAGPAGSPRSAGAALSLRWLLVTGALWAAPLLVAPPAASRDIYSYACQGALWLDGVDPYSVGVAGGGCPWTDAVPVLWHDTTTPYGPLAIALSGAVVAVARAVAGSTDAQLLVAVGLLRAVALAGGALIAGFLPRLARACGVEPRVATWLGLISPLAAVHLVSGAHNDALMIGLVITALALLAAPGAGATGTRFGPTDPPAANRPGTALLLAAGAALGLATAVKVTALVAVPFAILLAVRRQQRHRSLGRAGAAIIGAGLLVFAGLSLATGLGLGWLGALSGTGSLVQWTSLPTGVGMAVGYLFRLIGQPAAIDPAVTVARLLGLAALAAVAALLLLRAWRAATGTTAGPAVAPTRKEGPLVIQKPITRGPSFQQRIVVAGCGGTFGALAVLSPVFYPWYALAAIAVLAASVPDPRWIRRLAAATLVLSFLVLPNGLGLAVRTKLPGALLDLAVLVVLLVAARRALRAGTFAGWLGGGRPD